MNEDAVVENLFTVLQAQWKW